MPKQFHSQSDADQAIRDAIAAGKANSGYSSINFSGTGGNTVWFAHVQSGPASWCLAA